MRTFSVSFAQWYTTFEALIHHSINLYAFETKESGFKVESIKKGCNNVIRWSQFLHYAISEIARIEDHHDSFLLRQSIPRTKAVKELYTSRHNDTASFQDAFLQDYDAILDNILELASVNETHGFLKELKHFKVHKDGSYAFVGIEQAQVEANVECWVAGAQVDEVEFNATVADFVAAAKENPAGAMEGLEFLHKAKRQKLRKDDDYWLEEKWGNTAACCKRYPLALWYGDGSRDCQA